MLFNVTGKRIVKIGGYSFRYVTSDALDELHDFFSKQTYQKSNISYEGFIFNHLVVNEVDDLNGYRYFFKFIDGMLCIFNENVSSKRISLHHNPIGDVSYDTKLSVFRKCIKLIYTLNNDNFMCRIDSCRTEYLNMLNRSKLSKVSKLPDEFIFDTKQLQSLEGKKYKSVRNSINRFTQYNYEFREYVDDDYTGALRVYNAWSDDYKKRYQNRKVEHKMPMPELIWDSELFKKQLKFRRDMGIRVYVALVDNNIVGVSGMAKLCSDCSVILFEKCINAFDGITEFMWIQMLRDYPDFYQYECDGDGGKETSGLYAYKMKFKPVILEPMYTIHINNKGQKITESFFKKEGDI